MLHLDAAFDCCMECIMIHCVTNLWLCECRWHQFRIIFSMILHHPPSQDCHGTSGFDCTRMARNQCTRCFGSSLPSPCTSSMLRLTWLSARILAAILGTASTPEMAIQFVAVEALTDLRYHEVEMQTHPGFFHYPTLSPSIGRVIFAPVDPACTTRKT